MYRSTIHKVISGVVDVRVDVAAATREDEAEVQQAPQLVQLELVQLELVQLELVHPELVQLVSFPLELELVQLELVQLVSFPQVVS